MIAVDHRLAAAPARKFIARYAVGGCDDILYRPGFLSKSLAERCYAQLAWQTRWVDEFIRLFGKDVPVPRRCAWFGDAGSSYRYSGLTHRASGLWAPAAALLRDRLAASLGIRFNFVLLNLYRDGSDSMGWHADDESELGDDPYIASLSLGASRRFCLRARDGSGRRAELELESGSLLLMWGRSQHNWQHSVPRTRRCIGPRINLTFRQIKI